MAKIDGNGDLQLLIPVQEKELKQIERPYTVNVPYTETVDGVDKQLTRQETRTQNVSVTVCKNTFKMVRTSIPGHSVELTDIFGAAIPYDQLQQRLSQTAYVLLGPSALSPFVTDMLRKDALFLSTDKLDTTYHELPAVQGLSEKWTRPEGLLTTALAQLEPGTDRIAVTLTHQKMVPEVRTRMVTQADGSAAEVAYTIMVPIDESVQESVDLSKCEMATVGGEQVTLAKARKRLAEPCRIFFESHISAYCRSVLEADTLVIRTGNKQPAQ